MINAPAKFRYDINALRAIAVIAVMLYHFNVPYFNGGFSGVDIFFVISGFLMTSIILTGIDNGTFSIADFYSKRLKRIVPALLVLVITLSVIGFFLYLPSDYQLNEKNATASVLFYSNIFYWIRSGYFDPSAETNILLHTWSLSVEWQFYLLYPLILLLLTRLIKDRFKFELFFVGATVFLMVLSFLFTKRSPTASFYLLPSRAWEMMFGGIAFFMQRKVKINHTRKAISIFGYIALLIGFPMFTRDMDWPGIYTAIPVIITTMILIAGYSDFTVLKNGMLQYLGKISYSLYLWHWPVYVISKYFAVETNTLSILCLITLSLLLASFSYRFVENIRYNSNIRILSATVKVSAATAVLGFIGLNGFLFKPKAMFFTTYKSDHVDLKKQFSAGCCFISKVNVGKEDLNKTACLKLEKDKRNILLLGDSHAAQISLSMRKVLNYQNINLLQATSSGCLPVKVATGERWCTKIMDYVYNDFILNHSNEIDGIFICANWIDRKSGNNAKMISDLKNTLKYLNELKIPVVIIGQNETFLIPYTAILAKEVQYNISSTKRQLNLDSYRINAVLKSAFKERYIDIANTETFPKLAKNGSPYMFDENHFTEYGADLAMIKVFSNPITKKFMKSMDDKNRLARR